MKNIVKHARTLLFLSIFALSSCGNTPEGDKYIFSVIDAHKGYVVGETYSSKQELVMSIFKNGEKIENVSYEDIEVSIVNKEDKQITVNPEVPFSISGTYKVTLAKDSYHYSYSINVFDNPIYVNSIEVSGVNEMNKREIIELTFNVNPNEYTSYIDISTDRNDLVTIEKSVTGCLVYANTAGTVNIEVSSINSLGEKISDTHEITIKDEMDKTIIDQTYIDFFGKMGYSTNCCPSIGDINLLVVPVWFENSLLFIKEENKEKVREDIDFSYNGTIEETGWHSVSSFYNEESNGLLNLHATVTEWYECGYNYQTFANTYSATETLVRDAVKWYFDNNPEDSRSNYDYDNDMMMDGVMLIYGAPDNHNEGFYDCGNLWGYTSWTMDSPSLLHNEPIPNVFFWASYDFMYDAFSASSRAGTNYSVGDTRFSNVDAHCFIHEMGHVLGLNDYYDYNGKSSPSAGFSMQDSNIGGHDPYSVMALGWANPYIPKETTTISLASFQETRELILLTPNWNDYDSPFDEYLLLELYTPTGLNEFDSIHTYGWSYPKGPERVGVRLWHIDSRLVNGIRVRFFTDARGADTCMLAMSNTTYSSLDNSGSPLGGAYSNYSLIELIRNDVEAKYRSNEYLKEEDLFYAGDTFSIEKYAKQFVKKNALNSKTPLGWTFKINKISKDYFGYWSANITLTKI